MISMTLINLICLVSTINESMNRMLKFGIVLPFSTMSSIARVRGMMDLGESALRRRGFIDAAFATVTNCYQFVGLQTPIVEPAQLFSRSLGAASELVRKEMFLLSSVKKERNRKKKKKNFFFCDFFF